MTKDIQLFGRVILQTNIQALTGLHIGGSTTGMEIGGIDNPIIRDPLTMRPFIPGSSLRGKMRSQLEKALGKAQNQPIGQANIHTCKQASSYNANGGCAVCHVFGVPGDTDFSYPALLVVRDVLLTDESARRLEDAHTDFAYTEFKSEVAIDRVTSKASPRSVERVPAGAIFGPSEMVFNIYAQEDIARFKHVIDGLQLVEDDYLGGYGSRGSGKVAFKQLRLSTRSTKDYSQLYEYEAPFESLHDLIQNFSDVLHWIKTTIPLQ